MNSFTVKVNPEYEVICSAGSISHLGEYIKMARGVSKAMLVTDSNVAKLYLDVAEESLKDSGFEVSSFVFDAGEQSKNSDTYLRIIDALAQNGFLRCDLVVALGGGVVGDIAGFAAATYMRGIDVVQVPTTLLAMTDSAIGGKTGVDLMQGKNLLGAFHQPRLVLADINLLDTMQNTDWQNGIGEGIKYALLCGGEVLDILNCGLDKSNLQKFVHLCAAYKARIVEADEKEGDMRKLLNLGHTLGHAIEKESNFSMPHGIAVAQSIRIMAEAAYSSGELSKVEFDIIKSLLLKYNVSNYNIKDIKLLLSHVAMDKKAGKNNTIDIVKINGIANCTIKKMTLTEFANYVSI